jgi:hypothetical protein
MVNYAVILLFPDGRWGQWTSYGSCISNCSASGFQTRSRVCTFTDPTNQGSQCPGANVEARSCIGTLCPEIGKLI